MSSQKMSLIVSIAEGKSQGDGEGLASGDHVPVLCHAITTTCWQVAGFWTRPSGGGVITSFSTFACVTSLDKIRGLERASPWFLLFNRVTIS